MKFSDPSLVQLLGLRIRESYLDPQLIHAFEELSHAPLEAGFTKQAEQGRSVILQEAVGELRRRRGRPPFNASQGFLVEWGLLPGTLAVLQEVEPCPVVMGNQEQHKHDCPMKLYKCPHDALMQAVGVCPCAKVLSTVSVNAGWSFCPVYPPCQCLFLKYKLSPSQLHRPSCTSILLRRHVPIARSRSLSSMLTASAELPGRRSRGHFGGWQGRLGPQQVQSP